MFCSLTSFAEMVEPEVGNVHGRLADTQSISSSGDQLAEEEHVREQNAVNILL